MRDEMPDDDLDGFIAGGTRLLGIAMAPEWQPPVRGHLRVALTLGRQLSEFALPDEAEPAPVFFA
jgi:hypothetical protein